MGFPLSKYFESHPTLLSMTQPLKPWKRVNEPTCPWVSQLSDSLLPFLHEKEDNTLGVLTQKPGGHHQPTGCYSQQLDPVAWGSILCLRAITATAFLVKDTKEVIMRSPLTIFVPCAIEGPLNYHHIQHFSVSCFSSFEIVLCRSSHNSVTL